MPSFSVDKTSAESSETAEQPAVGCLYWNLPMNIKCNVNATYGHFYMQSGGNDQPGTDSNQFSKMLVISKTRSAHLHVQVPNRQCRCPNEYRLWCRNLSLLSFLAYSEEKEDFCAYLRILVGIIQLVFFCWICCCLDYASFLSSFGFILLFVHHFVSMC